MFDLETQIYELFIRFKNASKEVPEVEYSKQPTGSHLKGCCLNNNLPLSMFPIGTIGW